MAATSPASRLITAAAQQRLRPLGLRQQSQSRIWIDDHRWWITIAEFPSPRWSQSSGLAMGAMGLWQDHDHLAFDFVEQVRPTEEFRDETQFTSVAATLAQGSGRCVEDFRTRFVDLGTTAQALLLRPSLARVPLGGLQRRRGRHTGRPDGGSPGYSTKNPSRTGSTRSSTWPATLPVSLRTPPPFTTGPQP
ncbi:hypothetical protein AB0J38_14810 [Streptomyces sp. NPDC050095]|uniref:hypothetical protein n=1 Tax=unclassified Streptomyces TaxID=2593676 RepID=UPI00341EDDA4